MQHQSHYCLTRMTLETILFYYKKEILLQEYREYVLRLGYPTYVTELLAFCAYAPVRKSTKVQAISTSIPASLALL